MYSEVRVAVFWQRGAPLARALLGASRLALTPPPQAKSGASSRCGHGLLSSLLCRQLTTISSLFIMTCGARSTQVKLSAGTSVAVMLCSDEQGMYYCGEREVVVMTTAAVAYMQYVKFAKHSFACAILTA